MVQNLQNDIIVVPELADMRRRLKNLETKDGQILFVSLYNSWCHNAVATFSLCLLAQAYEHASNLLQSLYALKEKGCVLIVVVISKLQFSFSCRWTNLFRFSSRLCSPVCFHFTTLTVDLRLQLLEPEKYPYLFKCLYGLLMLLPQSSAFLTLRNRLNSISQIGYLHLFPRPYSHAFIKKSNLLVPPSSHPPVLTVALQNPKSTR